MGMPSRSHLCGHLARPGYLSFMSVGWASWKVAGLESSCWHLSSALLLFLAKIAVHQIRDPRSKSMWSLSLSLSETRG